MKNKNTKRKYSFKYISGVVRKTKTLRTIVFHTMYLSTAVVAIPIRRLFSNLYLYMYCNLGMLNSLSEANSQLHSRHAQLQGDGNELEVSIPLCVCVVCVCVCACMCVQALNDVTAKGNGWKVLCQLSKPS